MIINFNLPTYVLAFFSAKRNNILKESKGITGIEFKISYGVNENIAPNFLQHIVNLKADRSFARDENDSKVIKEVDIWFNKFDH